MWLYWKKKLASLLTKFVFRLIEIEFRIIACSLDIQFFGTITNQVHSWKGNYEKTLVIYHSYLLLWDTFNYKYLWINDLWTLSTVAERLKNSRNHFHSSNAWNLQILKNPSIENFFNFLTICFCFSNSRNGILQWELSRFLNGGILEYIS